MSSAHRPFLRILWFDSFNRSFAVNLVSYAFFWHSACRTFIRFRLDCKFSNTNCCHASYDILGSLYEATSKNVEMPTACKTSEEIESICFTLTCSNSSLHSFHTIESLKWNKRSVNNSLGARATSSVGSSSRSIAKSNYKQHTEKRCSDSPYVRHH